MRESHAGRASAPSRSTRSAAAAASAAVASSKTRGGGCGCAGGIVIVITTITPTTSAIVSQNHAKILTKRLRTRSRLGRGRERVDVARAANRLDAIERVRARAELLPEVADVLVDAAVERRYLAP